MHANAVPAVAPVVRTPPALASVEDPGLALRRAFAHVPSGVVAICAEIDGELVGMAASTFVPVSLDPPLVAFCAQNASATWARLSEAPVLGISVLGADHDAAARALGSKGADRFAGIGIERHPDGAVLLAESPLKLTVSVHSQTIAGDHTVVVFAITDLECAPDPGEPMVFHRSGFRRLVPEQVTPRISGSWVGASFFPA